MAILKRICITNDAFRSTERRRGTLDTLPQTPGTVPCFTSLSCDDMFPFHYCSTHYSISMILCSGLWYFFKQQYGFQDGTKRATYDVITACLIGLSAKLHDFEYLHSHLAFLLLSVIYVLYLAFSVLIRGLQWGHTAGIPEIFQECCSVRTVRDWACVCLIAWVIWGTGQWVVKVDWSHR